MNTEAGTITRKQNTYDTRKLVLSLVSKIRTTEILRLNGAIFRVTTKNGYLRKPKERCKRKLLQSPQKKRIGIAVRTREIEQCIEQNKKRKGTKNKRTPIIKLISKQAKAFVSSNHVQKVLIHHYINHVFATSIYPPLSGGTREDADGNSSKSIWSNGCSISKRFHHP